MAANIQLDEGTSGKYTETKEVDTDIHRQVVDLGGVGACKLIKGGTPCQLVTCTVANTDYTVTTELNENTAYLAIYCEDPIVVAMGAAVTATNGIGLAEGLNIWAVEPSGTAADDKLHVQSPTAGAVVRVTEMGD